MGRALTKELIENIAPKIHRHLVKMGANPEDAKDIVQDALYKAWLYIDSINPSQLPAWLFKVSINHYYDLCRKRNRYVTISIDAMVLGDNETPEITLINEEDKSRIAQALDGLSPIQKHLLVLKYEQDLSYEEISNLLGVPVSTVSTYLYRARQKFVQAYEEVTE